jgi:hypothetical protein
VASPNNATDLARLIAPQAKAVWPDDLTSYGASSLTSSQISKSGS